MGFVFSITKIGLWEWLKKEIENNQKEGFKLYQPFCYIIYEPMFKITNKKPIKESSKSLRHDYYFEGMDIEYAIELLNDIGEEIGTGKSEFEFTG